MCEYTHTRTIIHVCLSILTLDVKKTKKKANNTRYSQAVTHPSTNRAQCCLTSQIGRDAVCSTRYGRWQQIGDRISLFHQSPASTF